MASARPRPRPRPRPKARVNPQNQASSSDNAPSPALPIVVDDDDMFIRNQGRSTMTWKKLDQMNELASKQKAARSDSGNESDSSRPKKQTKKTGDSTQAKIDRLLSEGLSEDSDSDVVAVSPVKKNKRRSRSRSITPPPALPRLKLQEARDIVRKTLGGLAGSRSPSPPPEADESADTINLDPELQKIVRSAQANRSRSEPGESDTAETLEITVRWQPHPLNASGQMRENVFKLNRTDNFRILMEAVADDAAILFENLVLRYNGVQLFPSATPASLKLWVDAELDACDKTTLAYLRANASAPEPDDPVIVLSDTEAPSSAASNEAQDSESDDGGETFKLILRSALTTKDITLTVRPTTTCGAIVQAFLKKADLADKYGTGAKKGVGSNKGKRGVPEKYPQLVIDGDKMAPNVPIGDMDLDDGDMVDVVGL